MVIHDDLESRIHDIFDDSLVVEGGSGETVDEDHGLRAGAYMKNVNNAQPLKIDYFILE